MSTNIIIVHNGIFVLYTFFKGHVKNFGYQIDLVFFVLTDTKVDFNACQYDT
jgi:hypothetical protein